ncbi:entericidin [Prevotella brunnea]|uniref:Entericidin n=1 Tax=Prevotella brunnea TaxID=2508867 RepID=A0A5C8GJS6_9BACT|nr:entericidin [Prevotella brunnea]MDR0186326.1 entericidin [Prevotella brunnea]TXJ62239.1 entericidin [Prevotella brunnea]
MKKVILMFVAVAAISFASCGNNAKPAADADSLANDTVENVDSMDSTTTQADSVATPADSTVAE